MKTEAIVVLFNDNTDTAKANVIAIAAQVDEVCLIDNSSSSTNLFGDISNCTYLPQFKNLGIAAAQNIGIKHAVDNGADFVLMADPDSNIPGDAVATLLKAYDALTTKGYKVCCVGSVAYDGFSGNRLPLTANYKGKIHLDNMNNDYIRVDYVMNSISLIPTEYFEGGGFMDESLFIDDVDCEWCWRTCRKENAECFLYEGVKITHHLGIGDKSVGYRKISIGTPFRLYYQIRNFIWLCKREYVPRKWLAYNGAKYFVKLFYYPLMVKPRMQFLRNELRGIRDGFKGLRINYKRI